MWEDECGPLSLVAVDDDVQRYGKAQSLSWNVLSSVYPLYQDADCTIAAVVGDAASYTTLYYHSATPDYHGAYGAAVLRAWDGVAFSRPRTIAACRTRAATPTAARGSSTPRSTPTTRG